MAIPQEWQLAPLRDADKVRSAVARYGSELAPRMRGDGRREDQLRAPVYRLLKDLGRVLGRDVVVHDEVALSDVSARPDFAVDTPGGRLGYIELKAPEKGIPSKNWRPSKHDREQQEKLSALPNLIYTNGQYWGLFRRGTLISDVAVLKGDLARSGHRLVPADGRFERLVKEFLAWKPDRPASLRGIVAEIAPLCRLLRDQVTEVLTHESTSPAPRLLTALEEEWRNILFPHLDQESFADSYAQAVTFALLLARVDGILFEDRSLADIATKLSKQHSLLGEALALLTNHRWVKELSVVETIRRVVGNIDWDDIHLDSTDAYSLLYETFLAEYDPRLRRRSGTYYTPDAVARSMVGFSDQVLKQRLGVQRGFASDDVTVVDPAMGTGTFLVEIIDSVVTTLQNEYGTNVMPQAHLRELFAERLVGFELQVAPYAVAEVRLHHTLKCRYGVEIPPEEVRFLSNTFDPPEVQLALSHGQLYRVLEEARQEANRIKRDQPVMVVIGNPPWRERAQGEAPWLEAPRDRRRPPDFAERPSLDEFRASGQARRAFNLSNMWTFYWRWAAWKVFDAHPADASGVVVLITPKAYATSESHAGMRRYLRETADEGWIIDLSPEDFRPDAASRIFPEVQQPICIGVFARYRTDEPAQPARVHHIAIEGARQEKFDELTALSLDDERWHDTPSDWEAPFQPTSPDWEASPRLADLFPWHRPGVNSNRNWVWAPDAETLRQRWSQMVLATREHQDTLFKITPDRSSNMAYPPIPGVPSGTLPLRDEQNLEPTVVRVAYRSFDRQYLIYDRRVIDRPRPDLWCADSDRQIYISEQHAHPISSGTALTFSALVPNVHHFNGRGGRVLPLYRDRMSQDLNVAPGLLTCLSDPFGTASSEDLLAYVAAIVSHPGYTHRYLQELRTPGIRVPLTTDIHLWQEAVDVGREVIWLHTYGERFCDESAGRPRARPRTHEHQRPRLVRAIPASPEEMPDQAVYDSGTQRLTIGRQDCPDGGGTIERVAPAVWEYTVGGGVPVVRRWLNYRLRNPRHRRQTSPLDGLNADRWTAEFDDELVDLLNVLDRLVALEPHQANLLERVCASPRLTVTDLEQSYVLPVAKSARQPARPPAELTLSLDNRPDES